MQFKLLYTQHHDLLYSIRSASTRQSKTKRKQQQNEEKKQ